MDKPPYFIAMILEKAGFVKAAKADGKVK